MGDVAGIGPEVIARGWLDPKLHALARPLVIGDPNVMARALGTGRTRRRPVQSHLARERRTFPPNIPCLSVPANMAISLASNRARWMLRAGRRCVRLLSTAIDLALAGRIDAITTLPLNKQALHLGGITIPGTPRSSPNAAASPTTP